MTTTRKIVLKALALIAIAGASLASASTAEAGPAPRACTNYCVSGTVCDDEIMRIMCNGACPTWEFAVCYVPPNSCGGNQIKIYCIDDET